MVVASFSISLYFLFCMSFRICGQFAGFTLETSCIWRLKYRSFFSYSSSFIFIFWFSPINFSIRSPKSKIFLFSWVISFEKKLSESPPTLFCSVFAWSRLLTSPSHRSPNWSETACHWVLPEAQPPRAPFLRELFQTLCFLWKSALSSMLPRLFRCSPFELLLLSESIGSPCARTKPAFLFSNLHSLPSTDRISFRCGIFPQVCFPGTQSWVLGHLLQL